MKFLQRKAYESERGAILQVVNALNTLAPHVRHGPATVPCHILPEWHQGVVIATPLGNSAIYHCQSRWWGLPLGDEQMAAFGGWQQFRADEGEVSLALLRVGLFRDDLGPIRGGAAELARLVGASQAHLTMPVALNETEDEDHFHADRDFYDEIFDDDEDASNDSDDATTRGDWRTQAPQDWLFDIALSATKDSGSGAVPVVTTVPDGTLLSFVGTWDSAWAFVTLEHGEDLANTTWALVLKQGEDEKLTTHSRWPLMLEAVTIVEVAAATATTLDEQIDQHAGQPRRALREAQLTWATVCHQVDAALSILSEAITRIPHDADAEMLALALPRNVVGVVRHLNDSAALDVAQRARLETIVADLNARP